MGLDSSGQWRTRRAAKTNGAKTPRISFLPLLLHTWLGPAARIVTGLSKVLLRNQMTIKTERLAGCSIIYSRRIPCDF